MFDSLIDALSGGLNATIYFLIPYFLVPLYIISFLINTLTYRFKVNKKTLDKEATELDLSDMELKNLKPFTNLVYLEKLKVIKWSDQKGDSVFLEPIIELKNLKHLHYIDKQNYLHAKTKAETEYKNIEQLNWLESLHLEIDFRNSFFNCDTFSRLKKINLYDNSWNAPEYIPLIKFNKLHNIEHLVLKSYGYIFDKSIKSLTKLKTLKLDPKGKCYPPVKMNPLGDISALGHLCNLEILHISNASVSNIDFLEHLNKLVILNLACNPILSLKALKNLSKLEELDLRGCSNIGQDSWDTFKHLTSLKTIKGEFPPDFIRAKVLSKNACKRKDIPYIIEHINEWLRTVQKHPFYPGLLSAVAQAFNLINDVDLGESNKKIDNLVHFIGLATSDTAPEIDGLFEVIWSNLPNSQLEEAIVKAIEQSEKLLPPDTLLSLYSYSSDKDEIVEKTLSALLCTFDQKTMPSWCSSTVEKLRTILVDISFKPTQIYLDQLLNKLSEQDFNDFTGQCFGLLCTLYVRIDDEAWRDNFYERLYSLGSEQSDQSVYQQALSDLGFSFAVSDDTKWSLNCLDSFLERVASLNIDLSSLQKDIALSYADFKEWSRAFEMTMLISNVRLRDEVLNQLIDYQLPLGRYREAIIMTNELYNLELRIKAFKQIAHQVDYASDPVAYGHLLSLTITQPEIQKYVISKAIKNNTQILSTDVPKSDFLDEKYNHQLIESAVVNERNRIYSQINKLSPKLLNQLKQMNSSI